MKEICKISFEASTGGEDCSGARGGRPKRAGERLAFGFGGGLSETDEERKKEVVEQLIGAASRCVREGECGSLNVKAIRWDKCDVCDEHLPMLKDDVIKPLIKAGVPVSYEELDAKTDGRELFLKAGCQGTPCILVEDRGSGELKKAYDGRQKQVGALSILLGLPNPFFYGNLEGARPENLLNPTRTIRNSRSDGILPKGSKLTTWL
jgi:hypothetical protein